MDISHVDVVQMVPHTALRNRLFCRKPSFLAPRGQSKTLPTLLMKFKLLAFNLPVPQSKAWTYIQMITNLKSKRLYKVFGRFSGNCAAEDVLRLWCGYKIQSLAVLGSHLLIPWHSTSIARINHRPG